MSPKQILTQALERIRNEHGVRVHTLNVEWLALGTITDPEKSAVHSLVINAALVDATEGVHASH